MLVEEVIFRRDQLRGYEVRRHQSGKSFSSRVCASQSCFILGFPHDSPRRENVFSRALLGHSRNQQSLNHANPPKKKRRRLEEETQEHIDMLPIGFACKLCGKKYDILRGAQSHIYQQHILTSAVSPPEASHVRSRKSECNDHEPVEVEVAAAAAAAHSSEPMQSCPTEGFMCSICQLLFETPEDLSIHERDGISPPPIDLQANMCMRCSRCFPNPRALSQHDQHCIPVGTMVAGDKKTHFDNID